MLNKEVDFIAELHYLKTEEGGRKTPASSGYRPLVKFPFSRRYTSGQQQFLNKTEVYPGEITVAKIKIVSVEYFQHKLCAGMEFEIAENPSHIMGTGVITEILNPDLKMSTDVIEIIQSWTQAATDLNIQIVTPFTCIINDEEEFFPLLIRNFGSKLGTIISSTTDIINFKNIQSLGYYYSLLNPEVYSHYDRQRFVDTLNDWKYFGDPALKPTWYSGDPWTV